LASRVEPNIVITGFMGTGKSTVAPLVAGQLSRPFVDTDECIVEQAGLSISAIFARDGEAAFRKLEAEICVDLAAQTGLVIATGGGALLNRDTVAAMSGTGLVVCLTASTETIAQRLEGEREGRPLSAGWRDLLERRREAYAVLPYQVDTTDKSPEQVAQEVIALWQSVFE
jgi:shikimate kinase